MNDVLRAELPADLADELISKGFEELFASRGVLTDAGTVVTVASASLAIGANVATILVSRESLSQFVRTLHDWMLRKTAGRPHREVIIDISAVREKEKMQLRLTVSSENGAPQIDADALSAFINSLLSGETNEPAHNSPQNQPEIQKHG